MLVGKPWSLAKSRTRVYVGLGMCVELRRHAKERKMRTALFGLNGHLRDLFRMMKVDRLYKTVHSKDDLRKITNS